jgi:HAE1 family hydrophobic/amphiphilic exporter-1
VTKEQSLRTLGRLTSAQEFADIVLTHMNGAPVRLRDVAHVEDGVAERRSIARLNGVPSVSLEVRARAAPTRSRSSRRSRRTSTACSAQLPPGVKMEVIRDQSRTSTGAARDQRPPDARLDPRVPRRAGVHAAGAARSSRHRHPASVISTFGMMWALHFTLNSVTMLALVLMVGIVIDDAIVVLENIFRFVEEKKMSPMERRAKAPARSRWPSSRPRLSWQSFSSPCRS